MRLRVGAGLDRDSDRGYPRRQRLALLKPALERDDDRALLGDGSLVAEKRPFVFDETFAPPQRHQMPDPASSGPKWMPHSTLPRPRQRPARSSSPGLTGLVHGKQPMDGKPLATNGCRGNPASAIYFSTSLELQPTSGLILMRSPSASNSGRVARIVVWKPLRPVIQASNPSIASARGRTLRISQQRSGSLANRNFSGSSCASVSAFGSATITFVRPSLATSSSR